MSQEDTKARLVEALRSEHAEAERILERLEDSAYFLEHTVSLVWVLTRLVERSTAADIVWAFDEPHDFPPAVADALREIRGQQ